MPKNINELPYNEARRIADASKEGEKCGFLRGDLMRENPWPEPEGVKVVAAIVYLCRNNNIDKKHHV